jgi:hypothetical protein
MVFDIKSSEVLHQRDTARAMTGKWGCPPEDMLVQHPSSPTIVTCLDLHIAQLLIKKMVAQATSVCSTMDVAGPEFTMLDDVARHRAPCSALPFRAAGLCRARARPPSWPR